MRRLFVLPSVLVFIALTCASCSSSTSFELIQFEVSPSGSVATCQEITVRFQSSDRGRYSLSSGDTLLFRGSTTGLPEEIRFNAQRLDESARELTLVIAGENGQTASASTTLLRGTDNSAPIARPRLGSMPVSGEMIRLEGSLSNDPDGDELSYQWSIVEDVEGAALQQAENMDAILSFPQRATRVDVRLTVRDSQGANHSSLLPVIAEGTVSNTPPRFEGPAEDEYFGVEAGSIVTLEVLAVDDENDSITYSWRQQAGLAVELDIAPSGASATFTAPMTESLLAFDVTASDGAQATTRRIDVTIGEGLPDSPPQPIIELVSGGELFMPTVLSAGPTFDPDTEDLHFTWLVSRAPLGSLLGNETMEHLPGQDDSELVLQLDRQGSYRFELYADDGLGISPFFAAIDVETGNNAEQIYGSAVTDIVCHQDVVAWNGPNGTAIRRGSSDVTVLSNTPTTAFTLRPAESGSLWIAYDSGATPAIAVLDEGGIDVGSIVELPGDAREVRALALDPAPTRLGDVYVGTDAGTAILDISARDCDEPNDNGCWVGSPSTGYLHRPPSLAEFQSYEVDLLHASLGSEGETEVYLGNRYWLARLERNDGTHDFSQAVVDLFNDRQPQRITALALSPTGLYCGTEPFGVVLHSTDGDCGFTPLVPVTCARASVLQCHPQATLEAPSWITDLAVVGDGVLIASNDSFIHYTPALNRFALVELNGVTGAPSAIAVCDESLYLGTNQGLWELPLEASR